MTKKKIVVFTGAGISAESGIKTFRDSDGLWETHRLEDVATPEAWNRNPELVLKFYNERRRQLLTVEPNEGHRALVELEKKYHVEVITQNVDDLHERAGSQRVTHLHGELRKARSVKNPGLIVKRDEDINLGDLASDGHQLRPHIVWFGESVPKLADAIAFAEQAEVFMVIGSSLQVYPAASIMLYADPNIPYYYIDPNPQVNWELGQVGNLKILAEKASVGVRRVVDELLG